MNRRKNTIPYFQLLALLLTLLSIPLNTSIKIKGTAVAILAPAWEQLQSIKRALMHVSDVKLIGDDGSVAYAKEEIRRLELENLLLANELETLKNILNHEKLNDHPLLHLSVPAQVIFRSPASWSNSLWINVGTAENKRHGSEVVAKNSPVVVGTSLVGVIDYAGTRQSRVRLVTDSGLTPSVRAMRIADEKTLLLAKGELRGSKEASWRMASPVLKGIGFNYDFPDDEGPARDLRTGEAVGEDSKSRKIPIIETGDTLITTGMDGVFPRGLQVAKVSKINLLKEGDYYYEIEAVACIKELDNLNTVFVLPPLGYDVESQAPHAW